MAAASRNATCGQWIELDPQGHLKVTQGPAQLPCDDTPLLILSILGAQRLGKSSLMNLIARCLRVFGVKFKVQSILEEQESCTRGCWGMFMHQTVEVGSQQVRLVFVDTEGLTESDPGSLMTFSVVSMLSSAVLFLTDKSITKDVARRLRDIITAVHCLQELELSRPHLALLVAGFGDSREHAKACRLPTWWGEYGEAIQAGFPSMEVLGLPSPSEVERNWLEAQEESPLPQADYVQTAQEFTKHLLEKVEQGYLRPKQMGQKAVTGANLHSLLEVLVARFTESDANQAAVPPFDQLLVKVCDRATEAVLDLAKQHRDRLQAKPMSAPDVQWQTVHKGFYMSLWDERVAKNVPDPSHEIVKSKRSATKEQLQLLGESLQSQQEDVDFLGTGFSVVPQRPVRILSYGALVVLMGHEVQLDPRDLQQTKDLTIVATRVVLPSGEIKLPGRCVCILCAELVCASERGTALDVSGASGNSWPLVAGPAVDGQAGTDGSPGGFVHIVSGRVKGMLAIHAHGGNGGDGQQGGCGKAGENAKGYPSGQAWGRDPTNYIAKAMPGQSGQPGGQGGTGGAAGKGGNSGAIRVETVHNEGTVVKHCDAGRAGGPGDGGEGGPGGKRHPVSTITGTKDGHNGRQNPFSFDCKGNDGAQGARGARGAEAASGQQEAPKILVTEALKEALWQQLLTSCRDELFKGNLDVAKRFLTQYTEMGGPATCCLYERVRSTCEGTRPYVLAVAPGHVTLLQSKYVERMYAERAVPLLKDLEETWTELRTSCEKGHNAATEMTRARDSVEQRLAQLSETIAQHSAQAEQALNHAENLRPQIDAAHHELEAAIGPEVEAECARLHDEHQKALRRQRRKRAIQTASKLVEEGVSLYSGGFFKLHKDFKDGYQKVKDLGDTVGGLEIEKLKGIGKKVGELNTSYQTVRKKLEEGKTAWQKVDDALEGKAASKGAILPPSMINAALDEMVGTMSCRVQQCMATYQKLCSERSTAELTAVQHAAAAVELSLEIHEQKQSLARIRDEACHTRAMTPIQALQCTFQALASTEELVLHLLHLLHGALELELGEVLELKATIGSQESIAQTFTQLLHHTATTRHRIAQDKQSFSIAKTFSAASLPLVVEWNMSQPELQGWCLVTATSLRVSLQIEDDAWPSHLNELTVRQAGISQQRSKLGKMVMARHHPRTFNLSLDSVSGQVASFKEVTLGGDKEHYVHISPASSWILAGASGLRLREVLMEFKCDGVARTVGVPRRASL